MVDTENLGTLRVALDAETKAWNDGFNDADRQLKAFNDKVATHMKTIGTAMTIAGAAVVGLAGSFVKAAADQERLMMGLTAVAGSASEAAKQMKRLEEVAKLPGLGFEEAIRASINLQAVKFSAQEAERYILAFGNALATVGKGKAELDGVILALTQMQSKGKVLAEELNQIAERVPQVRVAMIDAFGTGVTEDIQKMGITSKEFINGIVTELEKLPPIAGGVNNSFENLGDQWKRLSADIGTILLPTVIKLMDSLSRTITEIKEWTLEHPKLTEAIVKFGTALGVLMVVGGPLLMLPKVLTDIGIAVTSLIPNLAKLAGGIAAGGSGLAIIGIAGAVALAIYQITKFNEELDNMTKAATTAHAMEKLRKDGIQALNEVEIEALKTAGLWKGTIEEQASSVKNLIGATDGAKYSIEGFKTELGDTPEIIKKTTGEVKPLIDAMADLNMQLKNYAIAQDALSMAQKTGESIAESYKKAVKGIGLIWADAIELSKQSSEEMTQNIALSLQETDNTVSNYNKLFRMGMLEDVNELVEIGKLKNEQLQNIDQGAADQAMARSKQEWTDREGFIVQRNLAEITYEQQKNDQLLYLLNQTVEKKKKIWSEEMTYYADETNRGLNNISEAYRGLWELWHNTEMEEDDYQKKSIKRLADWVDKVVDELHRIVQAYNDISTIVHTIAGWFGGEEAAAGGGGTGLNAGSIGGLASLFGGGGAAGAGTGGTAAGGGAGTAAGAGGIGTLGALGGGMAIGALLYWIIKELGYEDELRSVIASPITLLKAGWNALFGEDKEADFNLEWHEDTQTWEPPDTSRQDLEADLARQKETNETRLQLQEEQNARTKALNDAYLEATGTVQANTAAIGDGISAYQAWIAEVEAHGGAVVQNARVYIDSMESFKKTIENSNASIEEQQEALELYNRWVNNAAMGISQSMDVMTKKAMELLDINWQDYLPTPTAMQEANDPNRDAQGNWIGSGGYPNAGTDTNNENVEININAGVIIADQYSIDQFADLIAQSMRNLGYI